MRTYFGECNSPTLMRPADADPLIEQVLFEDDQSRPGDAGADERFGRPLTDSRPATVEQRLSLEGTVEGSPGNGRTAGIMDRMVACLAEGIRGFFCFLLSLLFFSSLHGIAPLAVAVLLLKHNQPVISGLLLALSFAMLALTASIVALALSSVGAEEEAESAELDAYEVAVLAGGPEFATNTAIASLVHRRCPGRLDAGDRRLSLRADQLIGSHPLEDAIWSAIESETGQGLAEVRLGGPGRPPVGSGKGSSNADSSCQKYGPRWSVGWCC